MYISQCPSIPHDSSLLLSLPSLDQCNIVPLHVAHNLLGYGGEEVMGYL
jgi:hypothetical protein